MSVVVPFRGDSGHAQRLRTSFEALELRAGDELIVADNSDGAVGALVTSEGTEVPTPVGSGAPAVARAGTQAGVGGGARPRVVRANGERSSYHARNVGSGVATGDWLLFVDADCVPARDLLDAYFDPSPGAGVGALAGTVDADPDQDAFLARYASDRGFLDQDEGLHTAGDAAATANLLVRREAFEALGGFAEGIRSGGDIDLCRRLDAAGWSIERRPGATVRHLHRESLADLLGSIVRYAAGARWLNERYPGTAPQWPLIPGLIHCGRDIAGDLARLRFERAAFRGVDTLGMFAHTYGYRRSNAA